MNNIFINALNTIANPIHKGSTIEDYPTWFVGCMIIMFIVAILLNPLIYVVNKIKSYLITTDEVMVVIFSYLIGLVLGLIIFKLSSIGFLVLYIILWVIRLFSFRTKSKLV